MDAFELDVILLTLHRPLYIVITSLVWGRKLPVTFASNVITVKPVLNGHARATS